MKSIQAKSGFSRKEFNKYLNDASFYFNDVKEIQKGFEEVKQEVAKKSAKFFPYISKKKGVKLIVIGHSLRLLRLLSCWLF
mgnify:CR=1 FL=1